VRFLRRAAIDDRLDRLRHGLDRVTLPSRWWQHVEVLGIGRVNREAFDAKWEAISRVLDEQRPSSALDIGCNAGAFTVALAQRGIATLGVEREPALYRAALLALKRSRLPSAGIAVLDVTPETAVLMPNVDCVLLLAVWHHFVRSQGLEQATTILRQTWDRTAQVLFFISGEDEMGDDFGLPPLKPTPRAWFEQYLAEACPGADIRHLGLMPAAAPDGKPCTRNLFAVLRSQPEP
jgi:hypothetical protein